MNAVEVDFSIRNLPPLTTLNLSSSCTLDENTLTPLLYQMQHIQELYLLENLSYFISDNLVNLRKLSLHGNIDEEFNFELFKVLCNQLVDITIDLDNIEEESFF